LATPGPDDQHLHGGGVYCRGRRRLFARRVEGSPGPLPKATMTAAAARVCHGSVPSVCRRPGTLRPMRAENDALEAPPYSAAPVEVLRLPAGEHERDQVAVEEPLEIRIGGEPVAVTMRTPGHDEELALGFCLAEGLRPTTAALPADLAAN